MTSYERVATKEEVESLTDEEMHELSEKMKASQVLMDEKTFSPYIVVDGVRYDVTPINHSNSG